MKAQKREVKALKRAMKKACKTMKACKPKAKLEAHLDMDQKSVQKAGACVLKTWKVKNTGHATWAEDTFISFQKGHERLIQPGYEVVSVGAVEPGQVAYVRIML